MKNRSKILVVDDDPSAMLMISLALDRQGYDVVTASNGLEAISKVEQSNFDLIIMDMKMPHMNGIETYRRIRRISPSIPAVMLTGNHDIPAEHIHNQGFRDIAYKPLRIKDIVALVRSVDKHERRINNEQITSSNCR